MTRAVESNFVDPEILGVAVFVVHYANSGARNGSHSNQHITRAFNVLRIDPDRTLQLQDSHPLTSVVNENLPQTRPNHNHNGLHSTHSLPPRPSLLPCHTQQRPSTSFIVQQSQQPQPQQPLKPRHRAADQPPDALQMSAIPLNVDGEIPQWVSSLLDAVLNGVA